VADWNLFDVSTLKPWRAGTWAGYWRGGVAFDKVLRPFRNIKSYYRLEDLIANSDERRVFCECRGRQEFVRRGHLAEDALMFQVIFVGQAS